MACFSSNATPHKQAPGWEQHLEAQVHRVARRVVCQRVAATFAIFFIQCHACAAPAQLQVNCNSSCCPHCQWELRMLTRLLAEPQCGILSDIA